MDLFIHKFVYTWVNYSTWLNLGFVWNFTKRWTFVAFVSAIFGLQLLWQSWRQIDPWWLASASASLSLARWPVQKPAITPQRTINANQSFTNVNNNNNNNNNMYTKPRKQRWNLRKWMVWKRVSFSQGQFQVPCNMYTVHMSFMGLLNPI